MAGHSKWANIQHRKNKQDAKKAKVFTKIIKEITVAARMGGGGDVNTNPRLRLAVDKALDSNMTKDVIERAIKRGAGGEDGANMEQIRYEGYGPNGAAVLVECLTDNRNRTVGEIRHAFTKCGGNLGTDGSVAYLFQKQGIITFPPDTDENTVMDIALEAGADDVVTNDDGSIDVITSPENFSTIKAKLLEKKLEPAQSTVTMNAAIRVSLEDENAEKMEKLVDMLEDLDDVQHVYSNADVSEEVMQELA